MSWWQRRVAPLLSALNGQPDAPPVRRVLFPFNASWERQQLLDGGRSRPFGHRVTTDASFGGRSSATFHVGRLGPGGGSGAVFEGEISLDRSASWTGPKPPRLGFAAVTLSLDGVDEIVAEDFEALTLRARPRDDRTYSVTLRGTAPLAPDLSYQGYVLAKRSDEFQNMSCSFESFAALKGANLLDGVRSLDVARFAAISIAVADRLPGPFRFELEAISCTNKTDVSNHPIYNQSMFPLRKKKKNQATSQHQQQQHPE